MLESKLTEYKFQSTYKLLSIVYMDVEAGVNFWDFNEEAANATIVLYMLSCDAVGPFS
jgi:hypothetical protein